jgi:hypothetical protein
MAQKSSFLGKKTVKWLLVRRGVEVLKLWSDDQYPQIAIFQFTAEAYKKVRGNLSGFLNEAGIFGKGIKVQDPSGPGVSMNSSSNQPPGGVVVVVTHSKTSRSAYAVISASPLQETLEWEIHPRGDSLPSL